MATYITMPSTLEHIEILAPNLSQADIDELIASSGRSPLQALMLGYNRGAECRTWLADDKPLAMFGIIYKTLISDDVIPWMLGSEELRKHARGFLSSSTATIKGWSEKYTYLENYVDIRHKRAVRWLSWLGFTIHKPAILVGPRKMPFFKFSMKGTK